MRAVFFAITLLGISSVFAQSGSSSDASGSGIVNLGSGGIINVGAIPADSLLGLGSVIPILGGGPASLGVNNGQVPAPANLQPGPLAAEPLPGLRACDDDDRDGVCNEQDYCPDTPSQSIVMPSGCHLTRDAPLELVGVFFDFNGAVIRAESYEILDRVVALLRQQNNVIVEVGGHADARGNDKVNRRISEQRAKAVYDYLIDKGIGAYRLRYRGYGETQPVAPNKQVDGHDYAAGRARNRRVDLRVLGDLVVRRTE